jgi:OmpA-OmpF porin, OOP family
MKKTLAIAGLALWIFGSGWYYTCKIKERCFNGSSPGQTETNQIQGNPENNYAVVFDWNSEKPVTGTRFVAWRDSLTALAKSGKIIDFSGLYNQSEKNSTKETNLGLARATLVRALFPDIPDSLFSLTSRVDNGLTSENGTALMALITGIMEKEKAASPTSPALTNTTIYFPSNSAGKIADSKIDLYLDNLSAALKNSPKTLEIIGHTDNVGSDETNYKMGLLRANSIRSILLDRGVPASKISASSKGETQPVASNDSEDGRAKNRRTEIVVK